MNGKAYSAHPIAIYRTACCENLVSSQRARTRRTTMRKTILTILGSALLAGSLIQTAAAAEHHHAKHWAHQRAPISQPFRDSNAYDRNSGYDRYRSTEPDWSRFEGGAISAPAGQ
jgi:hypothetical protein